MPKGLFILEWDPLEGSIIKHSSPEDLDVNLSDVQVIEIGHQFNQESNWIILEDMGFKGVSYFDSVSQRALVYILMKHESAKDYVPQLTELAKFLLPMVDEMPEMELQRHMNDALGVVKAMMSSTDMVLLNLTSEIESMKEEALDLKEYLEAIMVASGEIETKIMILILLHKNRCPVGLIKSTCAGWDMNVDDIQSTLDRLEEKGFIIRENDGKTCSINPRIYKVLGGT